MNLYELLGVAPNANTDAINAAYRRTAKQFHPDATGTPASTRLMVGLNIAREEQARLLLRQTETGG
jgi:curved DNA-binding protein CbpA